MENSKLIARLLLDIQAVVFNIKQPFRYTTGILSPIYCDNRILISYPDKRKIILNAFLDLINQYHLACDVIAGTATAGIPHAAWIADRLNKPLVYIRGEAKQHGKQNKIEGLVCANQNALVIEDLISTGQSALQAALALRDAHLQVNTCLAIFDYQMPSSKKNFENANINLFTLTNFSTLLEVATETEFLNETEKQITEDWHKNPEAWRP